VVGFDCVIEILGKLKLPRVGIVRWIYWMLCRGIIEINGGSKGGTSERTESLDRKQLI
jgi:hypothetical protein